MGIVVDHNWGAKVAYPCFKLTDVSKSVPCFKMKLKQKQYLLDDILKVYITVSAGDWF